MKTCIPVLIVCLLFATIIKSQPILCEGNPRGSVWAATCCKCKTKCVLIDAKPRMPGDCRHCNLLCVDCRAEMGDLNKALEELKQKNRDLNELYQKKTSELQHWNKRFYDKCMETFGKEREDGGWTLDGLNGSFGTFFTSLLSVASNWTGPGNAVGGFMPMNKQWFATGLTLATNGMGIYQTVYDSAGDYSSIPGITDAVTNYGGTVNDYLTLEFTNWVAQKIDNAKMVRDFGLGKSGESIYYRTVYNIPTPPRLSEAHISGLEKFGLFSDIWAMTRATQALIDNLADIGIAWETTWALEKELEKIQEEIEKNNKLMACIKETQDFINNKGTGIRSNGNYISRELAVYFLAPAVLSYSYYPKAWLIKNDLAESKITVDMVRLQSAITKLKQLISIKNEMVSYAEKNIIPNFLPWITKSSNKFKPSFLIKLLQKSKAPFQNQIRKSEEMLKLGESIREELRYAFIFERKINDGFGNIANSPLSEYDDGSFYITSPGADSSLFNSEKWSSINNKKIPAGKGRVNLKFPADVQWSVDIYTTEDKFFTNRSSYSKHGSYDLVPGNYKFILNSVPVGNASVETGKETIFKVGIFNMMSQGSWELYDESKKTYYTSRNTPVKIALPVGTYILFFEKKDYKITIRNGMIVKFDLRKPLFVDQ